MSIHKSLKTAGALARHRNVLSREERIRKLEEAGRWVEGKNTVFGLPKVKNIKVVGKKKGAAKKKEEAAAAAAPAAGAAAPAGGTSAPAATAAEAAQKGGAKGAAAKPAAGKKE
ncbi:MAG: small basic protein [Planctomycetota bacterium]|nr:small basic protein [Planctomycetota bacterium]